MARYLTSLHIRRGVQQTFAFISDLRNAPAWDPQTTEVFKLTDGPIGAGTRFRLLGKVWGCTLDLPYVIEGYAAPHDLILTGETRWLRYRDRITLASQGECTQLTYDAQLDLKGALMIANPILGLLFRRIGDRATQRIPHAVERAGQ